MFVWPCSRACRILVPQPGSEPGPTAVEVPMVRTTRPPWNSQKQNCFKWEFPQLLQPWYSLAETFFSWKHNSSTVKNKLASKHIQIYYLKLFNHKFKILFLNFKGFVHIAKSVFCIFNTPSLWFLPLVSNQTFKIKAIFSIQHRITWLYLRNLSPLTFIRLIHLTNVLASAPKVVFLINKGKKIRLDYWKWPG